MILNNVGNKIINIGATILMPGTSMKISREIETLPAIVAFKEMGFVTVTPDVNVAPDIKDATATPDVDAVPDAEGATTKRRGRKPSADEPAQE